MIVLAGKLDEFVHRIGGEGHAATQPGVDPRQVDRKPGRRDIAYDEQVHIAAGGLGSLCHGPVYEGDADILLVRPQHLSHEVRDAECLGDDALQLGEDGRIGVRLVVDLAAVLVPLDDPSAREGGQVALQRARRRPGRPRNLPHVKTPVRPAEQQRENGAHRLAEENRGDPAGR